MDEPGAAVMASINVQSQQACALFLVALEKNLKINQCSLMGTHSHEIT